MKPFAQSVWKQRGLFFAAGLLFSLLCFEITWHWIDIVPYPGFPQQPGWLRGLYQIIQYLPWIAVAIVVVFRLTKGRRIRAGFYFLGTIAPFVIVIGWILFGDVIDNIRHRQKFDAQLWKNQEIFIEDKWWPPRLCMVDDLMSSGRLDSLSKNQVIDLLGQPFAGGYLRPDIRQDYIYYLLGPERGYMRIDSEWLFISFDDDGKVLKYWLYQD